MISDIKTISSSLTFSDGTHWAPSRSQDIIKVLRSYLSFCPYGVLALSFNDNSADFLYLIPAIITCVDLRIPFYVVENVDPQDNYFPQVCGLLCDESRFFGMRRKFTDENSIITKVTFGKGPGILYFIKFLRDSGSKSKTLLNLTNNQHVLYVVRTSGTTSSKKVVCVPESCINSNVSDFSKHFDPTAVVVLSPPEFDPFYVDIFTALSNRLPLYFSSREAKARPKILANYILEIPESDLLIQMTPTVYKSLSKYILIASSKSFTFILGGEPFPAVGFSRPNDEYYNIYGVTELSCWQSMTKIKNFKSCPIADKNFSFISETDIYIADEEGNQVVKDGVTGHIIVESQTRKCFIGKNLKESSFIKTGDLGYYDNGRLFFNGRDHHSNLVKVNGKKINLEEVRYKFQESLPSVNFVLDFSNGNLILYYINENDIEIYGVLLKNGIPKHAIPHKIIRLKDYPTNSNGKLDINSMREVSLKRKNSDLSLKLIKHSWIKYTGVEPTESGNFIQNGGDSHLAVVFLNELNIEDTADALEVLLNESYQEFIDFTIGIKRELTQVKKTSDSSKCNSSKVMRVCNHPFFCRRGVSTLKDYTFTISFPEELWKVNLEKCVDASVLVTEGNVAFVGSHSGFFISCDIFTGMVNWRIKLPDRIESSAISTCKSVIVGCYDGFLYCLDIQNGDIIWKYLTGGMIKASPILINESLIFGSYDKHLYSVQCSTGELLWKINLGNSSILASSTVCGSEGIVSTLNGTVAKYDITCGKIIWTTYVETPVFSSGAIVCCGAEQLYIVGGANGKLFCIKSSSGRQAWIFHSGNSIFSSIASRGDLIAFGSHDNCLYIGICTLSKLVLKSKVDLGSPVYSTPLFFGPWNIIALSVKGRLLLVEQDSVIDVTLPLGGETFSSPALINGVLIFGCRDNHLYGFSIIKK